MPRRATPIDTKVLADYADIAVGLVPRVRAIAFFDTGGEPLWLRGPSPPPPLQALIVRAQAGEATAVASVSLGGAMVGYVLPALREGRVLGACALAIAGGTAPREAPAPSATHVAASLAPVLNLLARTLLEAESIAAAAAAQAAAQAAAPAAGARAAGARTGTASRLSVVGADTSALRAAPAAAPPAAESGEPTLSERTRELEWLINLSADTSSGGADNNAIMVRILRGAVERMGCVLGAVLMPDRQVNLIVHQANAAESEAHTVLERMRPSLMESAMNRQRVVVVNQLADRGGARLPYKVIAVPVFAGGGGAAGAKATGVLTFLRPAERSDFERRHLYLCKHLSRQVATLISRRFDLSTGLHTRNALETHVRELTASNSLQRFGALLHIDIDQLHLVNDQHGFDRGDELIVRFAQQLQAPMLPPNAVAARLGGDQFAVFLPGLNVEMAERVAHKLSGAIHVASGEALPPGVDVTVSIGIAELTVDVPDLARAFAFAELACRAAKDRGRNRVEVYTDTDATMARRYADINSVAELRHALDNDRMTLFAQRIAPLQGQHYESYELLLRGLDDQGRPFSPERYLSAAQRYQLLGEVDDWVIHNAFEILSKHRGVLYERRIGLSINVSGPSLMDSKFWTRVEECIDRSRLAPALLTFEITESVALSNLAKATDLIARIKSRGCRFALDDFGIGVNSLSYLKTLPVNRVKIDGSFVRDILVNQRSDATVRAIVSLAREMKIETVAEYVENPEIQQRVAALGVDFAQGYAVARPETLEDMLTRVRADSENSVAGFLDET